MAVCKDHVSYTGALSDKSTEVMQHFTYLFQFRCLSRYRSVARQVLTAFHAKTTQPNMQKRGLYRVRVRFRYEMNAKRLQHLQLASCQAVLKNCVLSLFDSKPQHELWYVVALLEIDTPHPTFEVSAVF